MTRPQALFYNRAVAERAELAYAELIRRMKERAVLVSCSSLLGWDEETVMPPGGVENRSRQMALLAGMDHHALIDPAFGELLASVDGGELTRDPSSAVSVNVREMRRLWMRHQRLERSLVEEIARTTTIAQHHWANARQQVDFSLFAPWLERVLALKRAEAELLRETIAPDAERYDALLDEYEPGARAPQLAELFAGLSRALRPLIDAAVGASARVDREAAKRAMSIDDQIELAMFTLNALGFDLTQGRLDTAEHPFTAHIGPGDCRIATRFDERDFSEGFFATLHEAGHGLYDQGLDPEQYGMPVGEPVSLGIHESQARLWENMVGRSKPFWAYFLPQLDVEQVTLDQFYAAVNHVAPSPIRVRADQVTYDLHILIRFELERALIDGRLSVAELPGAWNDAYRDRLGLTPENDALGCLQDGHWAAGMIGYFPTYTLGNLIAAQLYAAAKREAPDMESAFARGDFSGLLGWLRKKVHRRGKELTSAQLVADATGEPIGHTALVAALDARVREVYRL